MLGHQGVALFERIMECGLVGGGVALLEEVCHWGWALKFQKPLPRPVCQDQSVCLSLSLGLLLVDQI